MECGARDFVCQALSLLAEHGLELSELLKSLPGIADWFREHIQALIGLAGFSFGVWKWWYFRERVLHKRLEEYLGEEEKRLRHARDDVIRTLYRPGDRREFSEPLFSVQALRKVLRRRNWDSVMGLGRIETAADKQLGQALEQIGSRLAAAGAQLDALQHQRASAHLLRGAIAAARAPSAGHRASILDFRALGDFRAASQTPCLRHQIDAKEFEAHQLRRLGHAEDAETAYLELEILADNISDVRSRDLLRSRCQRWRATLVQAEAWKSCKIGNSPTPGSTNARSLLAGAHGALVLRESHGPFQGWDSIEQGDFHYQTAFVCHNLGSVNQRRGHLDFAARCYNAAADGLPRHFRSASARRIAGAARAGLTRVTAARNTGEYDLAWLLPPLEEVKKPTETISDT